MKQIGPSDSETFQPLVQQLGEVTKDGDETILNKQVSISDLLPSRTTSFYRYNGSLSTPGCDEIVVWTVFDNPIIISEQQASLIRSIKSSFIILSKLISNSQQLFQNCFVFFVQFD